MRASEDDLIARYFAPLAGAGGLGLRDDAALLPERPGHDLVVTVDALVAGVHFLPDDPPDAIAEKALGVNLSDLAAKGAEPAGFLLALALPDAWEEPWLAAFSAGLGQAAAAGGCPLLGGDTVRAAGPLQVSVTAFGHVPQGTMVRRTTARAGDRLCVSGTIGDAALGLALRRSPPPAWAGGMSRDLRGFLLERYLRPRPRLGLAPVLRAHASAAMDISDGLAGDLAKMMRASGLTASIAQEAVPLSRAAKVGLAADASLADLIATGGDDYEILCAVPPERLPALLAAAEAAGIPLTEIGTAEAGEGPPRFRDARGERSYARGSYSHF
jgi:thiamine-monophosphate kinase